MSHIAVFCSANDTIAKEYFDAAQELGQYLAKNDHPLVYGGCALGLMECIAKSVHESGGKTIGVVPTKIEENGKTSQFVDELIYCDNLTDRKQIMMDRADIFIALPGGLGTLDEIFTSAASQTLNYHQKKVILYNVNGFWDTCIAMLDDLQAKGVMRKHYSNQIVVANSIQEVDHHIRTIVQTQKD